MRFIGIIPARYESSRFPGKPLALIGGKPMIQRVYEQVSKILETAIVATDDERIEQTVKDFGGKVIMTQKNHPSGTDRCYEAFEKYAIENNLNQEEDKIVIINIQGDEPFIQPEQISAIMSCFEDGNTQIATLVKPFTERNTIEELTNPNSPKVVFSPITHEAMYFSRSVIPYKRGAEMQDWLKQAKFYKHIGMYAYRADILKHITQLPQATLEKTESLEQLRWLEYGLKIKVAITDIETIGIDTPQDLEKANKLL